MPRASWGEGEKVLSFLHEVYVQGYDERENSNFKTWVKILAQAEP